MFRRFTRKRVALAVSAVAALALAAGAYAYFTANGAGTGSATVGSADNITLAGTISGTLYPAGDPASVSVLVTNPRSGSPNGGAVRPLAAPTITESTTTPRTATSASFAPRASQNGAQSECSLGGAAFEACSSPRSYSGLAAGSHTFQARAVQGGKTSSASSFAWTTDLTAPTVVSITRAGGSPTNAASVSWTMTFSESVKNVAAGDFSLAPSDLGGSPSITGVTGSAAS